MAISQVAPAQEAQRAELLLNTQGFRGIVNCVAFSPDGKLLAAASAKEVLVFNTQTHELHKTLRGQRERNNHGNCYAVAFSPNGRELLVGIEDFEHGSIRVYETSQFELTAVVAGLGAPCRQLAFSRDGGYLASASENGSIQLWDWRRRTIVGRVPAVDQKHPLYQLFQFPTDAPVLMAHNGRSPNFYEAPSGKPLGPNDRVPDELRRWMGGVDSVQCPHGGTPEKASLLLDHQIWMASGKGAGSSAKYWAAVWKQGQNAPRAVYEKHRYVVSAQALSLVGNLAASADVFGEVHLWDARTGAGKHVFRSIGAPVYEVRFAEYDDHHHRLAFGRMPGYSTWARNNYGVADHTFDFDIGAVDASPPPAGRGEVTTLGGNTLTSTFKSGNHYLNCEARTPGMKPFRVRAGAMPTVMTFLKEGTLGLPVPVLFGDDSGGLLCYDPATDVERRDFVGHDVFVTSVDQSADGRFLVSGSTDRTIRLWSLRNHRSYGHLDCKILSDSVIEVKPNSFSERAGIKVGDTLISLDDLSLTALSDGLLKNTYPFRPGQTVTVKLRRDGRPITVKCRLIEEKDVSEPLLNLFIAGNDQWIVWTPEGYYDASLGADALLGWHVNQGYDKSAKYFSAGVFREQMYRADIIAKVLRLGNVEQAIQEANAERKTASQPIKKFDLRDARQLAEIAPPDVSGVSAERVGGKLRVTAKVRSTNGLPVKQAIVTVDGRPQAVVAKLNQAADGTSVSVDIPKPPGSARLAVIGVNDQSKSEPAIFEFEEVANPALNHVKPSLYAVSIGIGKYLDPSLNGLQFPADDARAFANAICAQQGGLYETVECKTLLDAEATRLNMLDAFDWLLKSVTQRDVAMIFVSSHGFRDPRQNFYLATHEVDQKRLRGTGLSYLEFQESIQDLPCKVLVFTDSCHSGGIGGAKAGASDPLRDLVAEDTGAILFCSSTAREISREHPEWGHGAFTKALLDTLSEIESDSDRPPDQQVTVTELELNILRRVKKLTEGQQHPVTKKPSSIPDFALFTLKP